MLGLAVGVLAPSASSAQTFAMATAVAIPFLSGLFMVGANPPAWLDTVGSLFPVRHLLTTLQDQFNPFLAGSGWDPASLAFVAAWGVAALLAATWGMRREAVTAVSGARRPAHAAAAGRARDTGEHARPGAVALALDQANWATRGSLRDFGVVFFAVAMPVGLYALMSAMYGQTDFRPQGRPFSFFFACGMAVYGIAVTAFINMPEAVATARDRLVLKRLRGTPLALWQYLAGRTGSAIWIGLATAALVFIVAIAFFEARIDGGGIVLALGVALVGTLTLAACGYALVAIAPSTKAVTAIGLGLLLPLSFLSDIFLVGGTPDWMGSVGALFPLRPFVHAMASALDPAGASVAWTDLAAMAVWLVAATAVAMRFFRWEPKR